MSEFKCPKCEARFARQEVDAFSGTACYVYACGRATWSDPKTGEFIIGEGSELCYRNQIAALEAKHGALVAFLADLVKSWREFDTPDTRLRAHDLEAVMNAAEEAGKPE